MTNDHLRLNLMNLVFSALNNKKLAVKNMTRLSVTVTLISLTTSHCNTPVTFHCITRCLSHILIAPSEHLTALAGIIIISVIKKLNKRS